ncbi:beta-1,3-glucan-binding protein-like [Galleria mellonella]|uniref:Beta-1,3-glucan-binding protein-like n=1 Tax=Galleria mellonella TaxID=7137 RepID=A0ABM3N5X0_GALME|nr:beta-1,3-glucan-binding protein-like [Galleria mellonella]
MACVANGRVSTVTIVLIVLQVAISQERPDIKVNFEVLKPKGLRISIPDSSSSKISLFAFNGHLNRAIGSDDVGSIRGEVTKATNGRWEFEDPNVELKVGDVIHYYFIVTVDRVGYVIDNLTYTVGNLDNRSGGSNPNCQSSVTVIRGSTTPICSGQTIFEDHFDSLKENVWQIEQYIPIDNPEYPFVSYQRLPSDPTVSIVDGNLRIVPKLQQNQPGFTNMSIFTDNLNLFDGCTAPACSKQPSGADILPPVVTGRITTSKSFVFKYGTVHIRAKLPQGDWLYPEIMLEPFLKKYGNTNFASGVLKIAAARGNKELNSGPQDYGNKVLYGGPVMDFDCRNEVLKKNVLTNGRMWGDDYHEYSLRWSPDRIILLVDGVEWARVEPAVSGLAGRLPRSCNHVPRMLLAGGTRIAPFDDSFYITLGVSAGGISEFEDNLTSKNGWPKPWSNGARKAMLNFWKDLDAWYPTWSQSALLVDYVKVVAL